MKRFIRPVLVEKFPDAHWYVSSKVWEADWFLKALPSDRISLIFVPDVAAREAIRRLEFASSWITADGVPSLDGLKLMDRLAASKPHARVVVLPNDSRVLARDIPTSATAPDQNGYVLSVVGTTEDAVAFTPMASVLFPALVAHLITDSQGYDFLRMLRESVAFTATWERAELGRLYDGRWEPSDVQNLTLAPTDPPSSLPLCSQFRWQSAIKDWKDALKDRGIISASDPDDSTKITREFQLWRAMTDLDGYVACIPTKRTDLVNLFNESQGLLHALPEDRRHKSFLIVDKPGAGKTFMVECLARTLAMQCLTFNVAQMADRDDLLSCFDAILAAQGESRVRPYPPKPLIVFIDELNSKIGQEKHVYDALLDPVSNGTYVRTGRTFHLDPCIWVFASTQIPGKESASDKAADLISRLTCPLMDWRTHAEQTELVTMERIYIGVASIRAAFPDVTRISELVLEAFRILPRETGPRAIRRLVDSLKNIQYGRVIKSNLSTNWYRDLNINEQLLAGWQEAVDDEQKIVDIRSKKDLYTISRRAKGPVLVAETGRVVRAS